MRNVTIHNIGFIRLLGKNGPIVDPIEIDDARTIELVKVGYNVVEHANGKKCALTISNLFDSNRFEIDGVTSVAKIPVEEVVVGSTEAASDNEGDSEIGTEEVDEEMTDVEPGAVAEETEDEEIINETAEEVAPAVAPTQPKNNNNNKSRNRNRNR